MPEDHLPCPTLTTKQQRILCSGTRLTDMRHEGLWAVCKQHLRILDDLLYLRREKVSRVDLSTEEVHVHLFCAERN